MFVIRRISSLSLRRFYSTDLIPTSSTTELERKSPSDSSLWATSESNRLIEHLAQRIQSSGPITVADYMREASFHPKYVRDCPTETVLIIYLDHRTNLPFSSFRALIHAMKYTGKKVSGSKHVKLANYSLK